MASATYDVFKDLWLQLWWFSSNTPVPQPSHWSRDKKVVVCTEHNEIRLTVLEHWKTWLINRHQTWWKRTDSLLKSGSEKPVGGGRVFLIEKTYMAFKLYDVLRTVQYLKLHPSSYSTVVFPDISVVTNVKLLALRAQTKFVLYGRTEIGFQTLWLRTDSLLNSELGRMTNTAITLISADNPVIKFPRIFIRRIIMTLKSEVSSGTTYI